MTTTKQEQPKTTEEMLLEAGYIPATDAQRAIGASHVATIHRMVQSKRLDGKQVGVFWYVSIKSLLKEYGDVPGVGDNVRSVLEELGADAAPAGKKKRS